MTTIIDLRKKLRSWDNRVVHEAVEELRVRNWLTDGSLDKIALCYAHLEGADLLKASLRYVDFHQASLQWADLSMADLTGAKLTRTNLQSANLSETSLKDADLYKANLGDARNLTDEQLSQAKRLFGAIMPDGDIYDGRYSLYGDLEFARWGRVNVNDPQGMADFFGVTLDVYLKGQRYALNFLAAEG